MSHLRSLQYNRNFEWDQILIDGGVAIGLLPERMLMKVEKHPDDLVPTKLLTLNSYNCEACYLSSKGLSVKLRYPELAFAPTESHTVVGKLFELLDYDRIRSRSRKFKGRIQKIR
ncbi:hypothetical protein Ahy_B06g084137 isoform A [Arachis hypogaea]|uniref:Uncharacterized protein n=1 Tax=Arachis hypogaea TaxID=3818 RepID=A0A444YR82_ARAHY|nr:hypothetical protein Ahy_B06g084137 isoform A [Arachis hypogaea]